MLTALQRANLFVIPLDDRAEWFRYHHLFADLLRASLQHMLSPEAVTGLHRRAAAWYRQNGFVAEAVHHALAAKDFDVAADLIELHGYPMMVRGEMATVIRWFDALPVDVTRLRPLLCIITAWVLTLAGAIERVEPLLQQAEARFAAAPERDTPAAREVLGNAATMRAFFAMLTGDGERSLALVERAETFLPEPSPQVRSMLTYILGSAYRSQGQYEKAAAAFARQAQAGEASGDLLLWVTGLCEVVNVRCTQGHLREAFELAHLTLRHLDERQAARFGSLAKLEVALCNVLRERHELTEAHQRLSDVLARMAGWDMPTDQLFAYLALFRVQEAEGDHVGAAQSLRIAHDLKAAHPVLSFLARAVDIDEIRLLLATHDVGAAAQRIASLQPGTGQNVPVRDQELIMLARVRFAQGKSEEAAAILSALAEETEAAGRQTALLDSLTLQACVLEKQGAKEAALAVLIKALALAEPEGFVDIFANKGDVMRSLLAAARGRIPSPLKAYLAKLLDALPVSPSSVPGLVEPLTPRELEVLQLISAGDSNQTIADKLVITVNGVKKHTGNIFGKLHVNSRTQAIARARQLGLLSSGE
jgi:LuxR family maltose regulon positive regulatory protein